MSKYSLQLHRKLNEVIPVPVGLPELMADITREVIRFQPANVERFIADYLESMLISREMIYTSQKTMHDVFDSSLQIAEIIKREGVTLEKVEIGVKIIREEFETTFDESKFNQKLKIISRLTNECKIDEIRAQKIVNKIAYVLAHYQMRNSCYSKIRPQPIHHKAVKNTFDFHLRKLNSLDRTADSFNEEEIVRYDEQEWTQQHEQAASKIQKWYRDCKQQNKKF